MAEVMIGIDPHKASHTAVVIDPAEVPLGQLRVRACAAQAERLLGWAQAWQRTWAVEGAGGVGHLLAQQLAAAGEQVLDVPPKLAARVRLLQAGDTNKNDPNDAFSVAVAALRSKARRPVLAEDYAVATDTVPSRPNRLETLGNPVLTGMSRLALAKLIERLATQQAAQAQRRNYRRRGGDRQGGARGGIFCEKITDAERVLAVILGLRKICTWEIVAELFEVSRRTIGNASAWVRPLLEQGQCTISCSATRYSSAAAVLAAAAGHESASGRPETPR